MTVDNIPNSKKGLPIGAQAPTFEILDSFDKNYNLTTTLNNSNGVILEFYRGAE